MATVESQSGPPEGLKIDLSSRSSPFATEARASLMQASILGSSSLMLSKASSLAVTPRSSFQFNLKMGRTSNRKNRVLEVFPSDIFANGTLRKEFYLPLRIADTAREMLESRPPPYIKMINPLSVHALAQRHSRIMALNQTNKGIVGGNGKVSSLAGCFLEAGDRLLNVLQVQQGVPVLKYKLSLGLAMIDYVKEGCHSRDTSFFMLYMLSHESSSSPSPGSIDDDEASKTKLDQPETKCPESPSSSTSSQKGETKEKWMSGTEVGKWFVFAIVDLIQMSSKKENDPNLEPLIRVDTENLERIATEYGRYLLKKDVPPRPEDDSPVRPRRGRKPKSMVILGAKTGRSSRESESETESSIHDKGDEVSSEPSGGSLDHDVEKGKRGRKRGRQPVVDREAKRPTGNSLPSHMGLSLDSSLASACNMLVSLNSPGVPAVSPQIPPPFLQSSPQLFNLGQVGAAAPVIPQLVSMPHVSPPQGPSSFVEGANKTQGISFFHLTPSMFVPGDLPVANISPLIMAAASGQSPSPPRALFCLSPSVSPLLSTAGQSLFRSPYYYSPSLMGTSLIPGGTTNPDPAVVGPSLTLDTSIQQAQGNQTTPPAQQQQNSAVAPSQFVFFFCIHVCVYVLFSSCMCVCVRIDRLHFQQNAEKSDGKSSTHADSSK